MPESAIEPVLQARSATMKKHSELIKLLVGNDSTDTAQAKTPGLGSSSASNETKPSSASNSTPSEQSTTCGSSTSQNGSVSWDTDSSRSPISLQGQAVSPLSYSSDSSDSKSPNFPQVSPSSTTSSNNNDSMLQIGWLTSSQNHSMQDLQGEAFDPSALSACYQPGVDHNGEVQSLLDSDPISSPANLVPPAASPAYSVLLSNASPQQSAMSPGQFLDQASPVSSNYGSVISETSSSSNDIMAVSDVSSPPTVFSPEVGAVPAGDDSIPLSVFSIPFQNSQTSAFIPQASTLDDFNPQIPSIFNFSITHPHLGTSSNLSDNSVLESQPEVLNSSCSPFILNRGDFIAHQSSDGTRSDAIVPVSESDCCDNMNIDSSLSDSHPSANVSTIQDTCTHSARSYRSRDQLPLLESQRNNSTMCSSNAEIQDILQQFF
jgi:hypothetical protein